MENDDTIVEETLILDVRDSESEPQVDWETFVIFIFKSWTLDVSNQKTEPPLCLLERNKNTDKELIEYCTKKRFGFETTKVAPFEFLRKSSTNEKWSPKDYQFEDGDARSMWWIYDQRGTNTSVRGKRKHVSSFAAGGAAYMEVYACLAANLSSFLLLNILKDQFCQVLKVAVGLLVWAEALVDFILFGPLFLVTVATVVYNPNLYQGLSLHSHISRAARHCSLRVATWEIILCLNLLIVCLSDHL
ncbi:hypothetical protein Tco_1263481 [Tanacetum coccineum]